MLKRMNKAPVAIVCACRDRHSKIAKTLKYFSHQVSITPSLTNDFTQIYGELNVSACI